jgi:hypothetical protein
MKFYCLAILIAAFQCLGQNTAVAQDSVNKVISQISSKYLGKVSKETSGISKKIDKKTEKLLRKLQKREARLKNILIQADSATIGSFFAAAQLKYADLSSQLLNKIRGPTGRMTGEYLPYFDSLKGSLSFLDKNKNLLDQVKSEKLGKAIDGLNNIQGKLQQADLIKEFIRERKQQLTDLLAKYTSLPPEASRALNKYKWDAYYYAAQIRDYKENFRDPDKLQRTALTLLNKIPAFQQFMKEHSELGGLFSLPGNYGSALAISGLQTRDQVQQAMAGQFGSGANVSQVLSQQVQGAQSQLDQFKQKLNVLGGGSGDIDMPAFKPNNQRTKTFLQRLEYGTNMQSTKSSYFWPMTTDLALTVGYKLNDKNSIGIGASYKMGWGKDIKHIAFTSEGIGLRSYLDINIKKSFYASGGFEYNYQQAFKKIQQLYTIDNWKKSGLLGITKIISIKSKVFKKTKLQLLWDFLSYQQKPRTEPIKFRVGYNL